MKKKVWFLSMLAALALSPLVHADDKSLLSSSLAKEKSDDFNLSLGGRIQAQPVSRMATLPI